VPEPKPSDKPAKAALKQILQDHPAIWQGTELSTTKHGISTGYSELDAILPGAGWPTNAVLELLLAEQGIGELTLFLPLMRHLTQQGRCVVWVHPPFIPYAPALARAGVDIRYNILVHRSSSKKEALWAMEKGLQAQASGLVLAWLDGFPGNALRRLQLAAETGNTLGVLFCHQAFKSALLPFRFRLEPRQGGARLHAVKMRGSFTHPLINLDLPWF